MTTSQVVVSGDVIKASQVQAAIDSLPGSGIVLIDASRVVADQMVAVGDVAGDGAAVGCGVKLRGRGAVYGRFAAGTAWYNPDGLPLPALLALNGTSHAIEDIEFSGGSGEPGKTTEDVVRLVSHTTRNVGKPASEPWRFPTSHCAIRRCILSAGTRATLAFRGPEAADQNDTCLVEECVISGGNPNHGYVGQARYGVEINMPNSGDGLMFRQVSIGDYAEAGLRLEQGGGWVKLMDQFTVSSNVKGARAAVSLGRYNMKGLKLECGHMELPYGDGVVCDEGSTGGNGPIVLDSVSILLAQRGARHLRIRGAGSVSARGCSFGPYGASEVDCGGIEMENAHPFADHVLFAAFSPCNVYRGAGVVQVNEAHVRARKIIGEWPKRWGHDPRLRRVGLVP